MQRFLNVYPLPATGDPGNVLAEVLSDLVQDGW